MGLEVGTVLKLDAFNAKENRVGYPRICISADIQTIIDKKVFVLDENDELMVFLMWFEEFPKGCGCCGKLDHTFKKCPQRKPEHNPININFPKSANTNNTTPAADFDGEEEKSEWIKVASMNKEKPPSSKFGNPKPKLLKNIGININYKTDSSSYISKSSIKLASCAPSQPAGTNKGNENLPTGPPSSESNMETNSKKTPKDDKSRAEAEQCNQPPSLELGKDENLGDAQAADDFPMEDFEGPIVELTQEELEAILRAYPSTGQSVPELPFLATFEGVPHASPMNNSMETKMENLGMQATSTSESSKRRSSFGDMDTASSKLKGSGLKKHKRDA